jgi:hypothetical protein
MDPITPKQAREYLDRRELVRQAEVKELRAASFETKLRQLDVLMASRSLFGNDRNRERQVLEVRNRWAQIWQALHV